MQEPALICQLYRKLGPCMVSKLQGDFAFVLHDSAMVSNAAPAHVQNPLPRLQSAA